MMFDTEHVLAQYSILSECWQLASSLFQQQSCQDKIHGRKEKPRHKKMGAETWGHPVFWDVTLQDWESRSQHFE
jgi:hypothetical protein